VRFRGLVGLLDAETITILWRKKTLSISDIRLKWRC